MTIAPDRPLRTSRTPAEQEPRLAELLDDLGQLWVARAGTHRTDRRRAGRPAAGLVGRRRGDRRAALVFSGRAPASPAGGSKDRRRRADCLAQRAYPMRRGGHRPIPLRTFAPRRGRARTSLPPARLTGLLADSEDAYGELQERLHAAGGRLGDCQDRLAATLSQPSEDTDRPEGNP